ncbi:MAG: tol-pal system protein YbgF [Alphaproteobacteria bacterium]|nr:MAG: tol-pal system protein YbgF [Alphaproteobacteria bacterium]
MRRRFLAAAALALTLSAGPAPAQQADAATLADIRQELTVIGVEILRLKRELNTTGAAAVPTGAGTTLDRVNALEAELTRLTAQTEALQMRIDRVVRDGTNRIGDLEFRLCELEPECDVASLPETPVLGGGELPAAAAPLPAEPGPEATASGEQLAVAERSDFDAAMAAMDAGRAQEAADRFAAFVDTYPGSPLAGQANYLRGEALWELGQVAAAARAYLASYSVSPTGEYAPEALLKLGVALGELGQQTEACVTLGEVEKRFPDNGPVAEAREAMAKLGCN